MVSHSRKKIPYEVEASVLIRCRRRCCLCFFLDGDITQKDGQIAHIDHDPANASEDNLVYLCFVHHDKYDSRSSQGKAISAAEVRHARENLHRRMADARKPLFTVTLTLDFEYDAFSDSDQEQVLTVIKEILQRGGDIHIKQKLGGSVRLIFELSAEETIALFRAIDQGKLDRFKPLAASIDPVESPSSRFAFLDAYTATLCAHIVSQRQTLDVIQHADAQQHFLAGKPVTEKEARLSLYMKSFGKLTRPDNYSVLVITVSASNKYDKHIVNAAFRVYSSDVDHSSSWQPMDVLKAFLDRFGIDVTYRGLGRMRLLQAQLVSTPPSVTEASAVEYFLGTSAYPKSGAFHFCINYEPISVGIFVELAFAYRVREYAKALRRHRVNVPTVFLS